MKNLFLLFFLLISYAYSMPNCNTIIQNKQKFGVGTICISDSLFVHPKLHQTNGRKFDSSEFPYLAGYIKTSHNNWLCNLNKCRFPDLRPIYYNKKENKLAFQENVIFYIKTKP